MTMAMFCTTKPIFNPLSLPNSTLTSLPKYFSTKASYPYLSLPSKPIKLHFSISYYSSLPSSFSLKNKTHFPNFVPHAASDWAPQEDRTAVIENEEVNYGTEAQLSNWEGEEEGAIGDATESSGEDGFVDPPEEAKIFVGNLPYDVDSEKLAQLFQQSGVVEIAEIIYNRETDQSRGFGFVTMSTVEEAEKAVEMFHRYYMPYICAVMKLLTFMDNGSAHYVRLGN